MSFAIRKSEEDRWWRVSATGRHCGHERTGKNSVTPHALLWSAGVSIGVPIEAGTHIRPRRMTFAAMTWGPRETLLIALDVVVSRGQDVTVPRPAIVCSYDIMALHQAWTAGDPPPAASS